MSYLKEGNKAFIQQDYKAAISYYEKVSGDENLTDIISFNLEFCKKKLNQDLNLKVNINNHQISNSQYEGYTDSFIDGVLSGWAVNKDNPSALFDLKIMVNGILFFSSKNDKERSDLVVPKKTLGLGGFSIQLPCELFIETIQTVEVCFPDGRLLAQLHVLQQSKKPLYQYNWVPVNQLVSVIVPIYNAVDDLKVCIERLVKYTQPNVHVMLIDDASTDERIQPILEAAKKHQNISIYNNEKNLGFTKTVNRGIELASTNDVVLLNSDARVTPRWLEGLKAALATDTKIATVTPMSDRAGAFSAPNMGNENDLSDFITEEDYAVAFRRRSFGLYPTVPTGNGFCLYIRRACIDEIGTFDESAFPRGYGEENDFCMRARALGWRNVIDDRTYVFHDRNKSFGDEKASLISAGRKIIDTRYPDYQKAIEIFTQSPLINIARYRARIALKDVETSILPRGLFVISTLTGGTPQTNRDLMLSINEKVEPWLLHCDSKVMSLYKINTDKSDDLIEQYTLKEAIEPLTHISSEYDQLIAHWLIKYDFELVHIRHLAWHSLNLPKSAKNAGARVLISFHDYYGVCPTVKLLDDERNYCNGKCSASSGQCSPELWEQDSLPYLKNNWVHTWRDKFKEALKYCDAYVTTHQSVKDTIIENLSIDEDNFHVIPHGRDFKKFHQLAEPYKLGNVLKILIPGNINDAKGSIIIEDLLTLDELGILEFHILGKVGFQFQHPRLIIHGEYERDQFAKHVKKIKPHVGAVFSIWNETWCHTLTELWSVGLPAVVTNYPTLANRVELTDSGWVLPKNDPKVVFNFIKNIMSDINIISGKSDKVKNIQSRLLMTQNTKIMAEEYLTVYKV